MADSNTNPRLSRFKAEHSTNADAFICFIKSLPSSYETNLLDFSTRISVFVATNTILADGTCNFTSGAHVFFTFSNESRLSTE